MGKSAKIALSGVLFCLVLGVAYWQYRPKEAFSTILSTRYEGGCREIEGAVLDLNICYEIITPHQLSKHQTVIFRHESGRQIRTLSFIDQGVAKVRFTPIELGVWRLGDQEFVVHKNHAAVANGFVRAVGRQWVWSGTEKAIIPQFIMYDRSDIKNAVDEFVRGHGFSGLHIANLRDFLKNPEYFEYVVRETYEAGGHTHFWIWADEQRRLTPRYFEGDVDNLYKEIVARLGPMPGWTVSYGFDLFEWCTERELIEWQKQWHGLSDYRHLMGARGHKNKYRALSLELDFVSWEWHRPTLADYVEHLERGNGKPVFSEDRFRIRTPSKYPLKDYNEKRTITGLWDSFLSGGVANIWGNRGSGKHYSVPYKVKRAIKKYRDIVDDYYLKGSYHTLLKGFDCLISEPNLICKVAKNQNFQSLVRTGFFARAIDILTGEETEMGGETSLGYDAILLGSMSRMGK